MAQRKISYAKQTLDSPNPVARLAHHARYGHSLRLGRTLAPQGGTVLDFGAGTGEFLRQLGIARPDLRLLAIEPYMAIDHPEIECNPDFEHAIASSIDLLTCFETLEHLHPDALRCFLAGVKRTAKVGANIVVSVPIMHGAMLPVKELNRMLLYRRWSDYSILELLRGIVGGHVPRPDRIDITHKGFDFRRLIRLLEAEYTLVDRFYSPFPMLPWWLNSQVFLTLRHDGIA